MDPNDFPFEITPVEDETENELQEYFKGCSRHVRVGGPRGYVLPAPYQHQAASVYHMPLLADDTFVSSYPRSGTTMTQEMVWLIRNNLDFEAAKKRPLTERYTYLEMSMLLDDTLKERIRQGIKDNKVDASAEREMLIPAVELAASTPSPRFFKTHLPLSLLPPSLLDTTKMVYVVRDPRDCLISLYYLSKNSRMPASDEDFDTYFDLFLRNLTIFAPILKHVKEAWSQREHPNLCLLFYEDMCKDILGTCSRVAEFFGKQYSNEQLEKLAEHLQFDNFKKNKAVDPEGYRSVGIFRKDTSFVRKGKSGGWREQLTEAQKQRAARWIQDNLQGTEFKYLEV